ncbi:aspartate aminotransferase, cytoplasmic [Condylostylus longicornis]|uniref:aspartate aminotransferase, cytoplasmic n=1 Tax=Condylostylus longicornis TaxID=2530218 RepID=UPI00244DA8EF|nr:aspartate aminotransferase, cytoplasmic [Condylostylus longicornis]
MSSLFSNIEKGAPIEVFALNKQCADDKYEHKINLSVGAYRTEDGKPWVLPVVRKTEIRIASDESLNHEYLPVTGNELFTKAATTLLLGVNSPAIAEGRAFGVQTLSGTGALRLGAEFLTKKLGYTVCYYSEPTWENHHKVFMAAGFKEAKIYRYWDPKTRGLDFNGLIEDLENAPEGAAIILHACAHNPTGCDPSQEQWKKIAELMKRKKLFPFFDAAYQGFASGQPDKDAWAVQYFVEQGFELFTAQSYAKNFGLYCERVGNLTVVQKDKETTAAVQSQFTLIVRAMYSNPPAFGSRIVGTILNDPQLRNEWMDCIKLMSSRIIEMRELLYKHLVELKTPGTWNHIKEQIGMFSYTGLTEKQVKYLIEKHHIYLLSTGRINMCGLNPNNVERFAKAIHEAVLTVQ